VEANGDVGMLGPEVILVDREGTAIERLGRGIATLLPIEPRQPADGHSVFGGVFAVLFVRGGYVPLGYPRRLGLLTRFMQLLHLPIECPQVPIGLSARRARSHGSSKEHPQREQEQPRHPHDAILPTQTDREPIAGGYHGRAASSASAACHGASRAAGHLLRLL